jgi:hypothetical protein
MDEWTGEPDHRQVGELRNALRSTAPRLVERLAELGTFSS